LSVVVKNVSKMNASVRYETIKSILPSLLSCSTMCLFDVGILHSSLSKVYTKCCHLYFKNEILTSIHVEGQGFGSECW
jgi:hypothetical protein